MVVLSIHSLVTEPVSIGALGVLLAGLVIGFFLARVTINHTTIDVSLARLRIARGPIPEGVIELPAQRIRQLFVQLQSSSRDGESLWEVCAILDEDEHRTLVCNLTRTEAVFLERSIEQRMGIPDRPVAGERSV